MTTADNLIAMGVAGCAIARVIQMFPAAADRLGAGPGAAPGSCSVSACSSSLSEP